MMQTNDGVWREFRRRGTMVLVLIAVLWPVGMFAYTCGTYALADDTVRVWLGDEAKGSLPYLEDVRRDRYTLLSYVWEVISSEVGATRWWTSAMAVLAGTLTLVSSAVPVRAREDERISRLAWLAVGLGLILIGLDERFQIHEWLRALVFRPAGVGRNVSWMQPGDIATFIYPIGAIAIWWVLHRSLAEDRLARRLLTVVMAVGVLAVVVDVLAIDVFERYPTGAYRGIGEEFGEWEVVALMAVVAWRRLARRLELVPTGGAPRG